mmetsp:Transcript_33459/g.83413  ORF Transcript_33459/g.83413 Transcript_33459/m.83413 type:complete len:486 (-) Transcript_33459:868-2325(-)
MAMKKDAFWSPEDGGSDEDGGSRGRDASDGRGQGGGAGDDSSSSVASSQAFDAREMLAQVRALRGKVETGRKKAKDLRKVNESLERDNEGLELEVEELRAQRTRLERRPKHRGDRVVHDRTGGTGGATGGFGGVEDVEFVDLDDDVEIAADEKSGAKRGGLLALIARLGRRFGTHLRRLEARLLRKIPIVRSVARLSTRYGASMAVYFSFCAWLMLNSVMQLLLFLPLLVKHSLNVFMGTTTTTQYESGLGGTTFGIWWAFYSSFPESDGALYTGACSLLILVTMIVSARKFIAERRAAQYIEVYGIGSDKFRFARAVLNGWDISVNSATTASEAHAIAADRLRLLVDEEERAARIAARSIRERNWLLVRRIVGIVISVAYTASAWAVIIGLQLYEQTLAKILVANSVPGASLLSLVGIPILVSAINVVLPVMTMMVTKFERWDDPSTTLRLQVFRLYLGKILNLLINVAGYGILVATQQSELKI